MVYHCFNHITAKFSGNLLPDPPKLPAPVYLFSPRGDWMFLRVKLVKLWFKSVMLSKQFQTSVKQHCDINRKDWILEPTPAFFGFVGSRLPWLVPYSGDHFNGAAWFFVRRGVQGVSSCPLEHHAHLWLSWIMNYMYTGMRQSSEEALDPVPFIGQVNALSMGDSRNQTKCVHVQWRLVTMSSAVSVDKSQFHACRFLFGLRNCDLSKQSESLKAYIFSCVCKTASNTCRKC